MNQTGVQPQLLLTAFKPFGLLPPWIEPKPKLKLPTSLQEAVHEVWEQLHTKTSEPTKLMASVLLFHKTGFGLEVHRHPKTELVHVWNKRFGDRPLTEPDHIDIGLLYSVAGKI